MGERNFEEECDRLELKLARIEELAAALDLILFQSLQLDAPLNLQEKNALFGVSHAISHWLKT